MEVLLLLLLLVVVLPVRAREGGELLRRSFCRGHSCCFVAATAVCAVVFRTRYVVREWTSRCVLLCPKQSRPDEVLGLVFARQSGVRSTEFGVLIQHTLSISTPKVEKCSSNTIYQTEKFSKIVKGGFTICFTNPHFPGGPIRHTHRF